MSELACQLVGEGAAVELCNELVGIALELLGHLQSFGLSYLGQPLILSDIALHTNTLTLLEAHYPAARHHRWSQVTAIMAENMFCVPACSSSGWSIHPLRTIARGIAVSLHQPALQATHLPAKHARGPSSPCNPVIMAVTPVGVMSAGQASKERRLWGILAARGSRSHHAPEGGSVLSHQRSRW